MTLTQGRVKISKLPHCRQVANKQKEKTRCVCFILRFVSPKKSIRNFKWSQGRLNFQIYLGHHDQN